MPAYQAQRPSLFGNVGGPTSERPMVDAGGAIQELGNVASSLIHQHYLRVSAQRAQEQAYARQNAEDEYRRQDREDRGQERADRLSYENRRLALDAAKNGVTLGTEGGATVSEQAPTPTMDLPTTSLHNAMTKGMQGPAGAPAPTSPLTKPVTPGSLGRVPNVQVGEEAPTPTSYNPDNDATLQRNKSLQADKAQTMLQLRAMMGNTQREVAQTRANGTVRAAQIRAGAAGKGGGGGLHSQLTGNALEKRFETVDAPGYLEAANWDLDAATAALNHTPEGEALRAQGFTARHLAAAWSKHTEALAGHAMKLEGGATGYGADEAVSAVDSTRKLVRGGRGASSSAAPAADDEDAKYQRAVTAIKSNFTGEEQAKRLKTAQDRYNARKAAVGAKK